ncbi:MAG: AAA family ATPase [Methylococcaceae bacterium]|nr:AAA family ATPase [Methylococcaceae bacterium]
MEHLSIKNFLCIEEAEFEVGRFNIIIGSQASGKSVISKLLYFFREIYDSNHSQPLSSSKKSLQTIIPNNFKRYFPEYAWKKQSFQIDYEINNIKISLINDEGLSLLLSDEFISLNAELKKINQEKLSNLENAILKEQQLKKRLGIFQSLLFIPATRSFFAIVQKNIFSFLANDIEIDPFLKKFGSLYENAKMLFSEHEHVVANSKLDSEFYPINIDLRDKISFLIELILKGSYFRKDEQDWIKTKEQTINFFHASSGQQESLPMLIILSVWVALVDRQASKIFIEEPEAHLFPVSQKHIISLLGVIYNHSYDFVITTHSPYILTAINNAILAHDVIEEKGKEAVKDIFDPDFAIKYEDVKAYTIENGRLISIMDDEARLIGASVIDSVSDEFETVFDNLLDLQDE